MFRISLAAVRVNADLTQNELAKKLDVDRQTIINWEKGHTKIDGERFVMWASICNFPIDYILAPKYTGKGSKSMAQ